MLLLLASALATQLTYDHAPCPVGEDDHARVYSKLAANQIGGWDSDLARYSSEGQWREYAIATCRDSLFSVYSGDMGMILDADDKRAIEKRLKQLRRGVDVDTLEVWDRYLLAVEVYRLLGRDALFLAQIYLEASWTARDRVVGVYAGLEGPTDARDILDAGALELDKVLDDHTRKIVLHNMARVAHRGGWPKERDAHLTAFEAVGDLDEDEARVLKEFHWIVDEVEPRLQDLALTELGAYLETAPEGHERVRATYLMADLLRRRGRLEEARRGFLLVAENPEAPAEYKDLATWLGDNG
ncbi:MAG TPA: hypothetical protein QGF58_20630 [Myxococcota bacterium]|nr:hypothetical protein [Myxococcota bacterium]